MRKNDEREARILVQLRLNLKARKALLALAKTKKQTLSAVLVDAVNIYLAENGRRPIATQAVMGRPKN
jgi:hypothetical protein